MKKIILFLVTIFTVSMVAGCGGNTGNSADFDMEQALSDFLASPANDGYAGEVKGNTIALEHNDGSYEIKYDLSGNPTFTYTTEVEKGISYDDFSLKENGITAPLIGYSLVLGTKGIDYTDSYPFIVDAFIGGMMSQSLDPDAENYLIIDDAEGVEFDGTIILTSEFGEKVMEYVANTHKDKITFEDEEFGSFVYEYTTAIEGERCTFEVKLTVNMDADFSGISGYAQRLEDEWGVDGVDEEEADYVFELAVGQKLIVSGEDLNGYEMNGSDICEISSGIDSGYEVLAIAEGSTSGYFFLGEDDERSFYITVVDNGDGSVTEDQAIKIE